MLNIMYSELDESTGIFPVGRASFVFAGPLEVYLSMFFIPLNRNSSDFSGLNSKKIVVIFQNFRPHFSFRPAIVIRSVAVQ